jgi:hypothetical protein
MLKYLSTRRHTNNLFRLLAATVLLLLQNSDDGYSCDAFSIAAVSSGSRAGGITRRRRRRRKHTATSSPTTALRLSPLLSPDHHDLVSTLLPTFTHATSHLWLAATSAGQPPPPLQQPPPSTSSIPILSNYVQLLTEYPLSTKVGTAGVLSTLGDAIAQYSTFAKRFEINHHNNNNKVVKVVQQTSATTSAVETTNDDTNGDTTTITIPLPPFEYDMKRGVVFCLFGMTYTGAFQHYWFPYLTLHINDWGHNYLHWWGDGTTAMMVDDGNSAPPLLFHNGVLYNAPPSPLALAAAKVVVNQVLMIPSLYMPIFLVVTSILGGLDLSMAIARAQSLYGPLIRRNWLFWFPTQFIQFTLIPTEWHIPFLSTAGLVWTIILSTIGGSSAPAAQASSTSSSAATTTTTTATTTLPIFQTVEEEGENIGESILVEEITGTDTIRVVDVIQKALLGQSNLLGATTTTTLVSALLMVLANTNGIMAEYSAIENSLEESSSSSATTTPEEVQILLIATAGWIGWTLGPKLFAPKTTTAEVNYHGVKEEGDPEFPLSARATVPVVQALRTTTKTGRRHDATTTTAKVATDDEGALDVPAPPPPKEPIVG